MQWLGARPFGASPRDRIIFNLTFQAASLGRSALSFLDQASRRHF